MQVDGPEATGFTKREKEVLCELLINYGIPVTSDTKNDYQFIRTKMIEIIKSEVVEEVVEEASDDKVVVEAGEEDKKQDDDENEKMINSTVVPEAAAIPSVGLTKEEEAAGEKNALQNLERFVQRIRMTA